MRPTDAVQRARIVARQARRLRRHVDAALAALRPAPWRYRGMPDELVAAVRARLGHPPDLTARRLVLPAAPSAPGGPGTVPAGPAGAQVAVLYLSSLVDPQQVDRHLVLPLLQAGLPAGPAAEGVLLRALPVTRLHPGRTVRRAVDALLDGEVVLAVAGCPRFFRMPAQIQRHRDPEEPESERVVRGAKEGFVEQAHFNLALVRRRLRGRDLRVTTLRVGRRSRTPVLVLHLEGVADPRLVAVVLERLRAIDVDVLGTASTLEAFLRDSPWTPFPTLRVTERPDTVVRELSLGRVAILTEGTPVAILAPTTLWDLLTTEMDYAYNAWVASFFRLVRCTSLLLSALTPGLYTAFVSFHPELIPNRLALSIAGSREGIPFPTVVEMSIMLLTFEVFREATLRMPPALSQTIGVVGGFLLGQAAVAAGIISDIMVIVIALTAIGQFTAPDLGLAVVVRIVSLGGLLAGTSFGLFGLGLWAMLLTAHLAALKSCGVPYLSPVAPARRGLWQDTLVRAPRLLQRRRPGHLNPVDPVRQGPPLLRARHEPGPRPGSPGTRS